MCGICGVLNSNQQKVDKTLLQDMCAQLVHRGPDAQGYYVRENIGLGHRRLSVLDLQTGSQPIHNESKTIWLITNGEIYNFIELRDSLAKKGHSFYTKTDAEVIVHLYEEYKEECLDFLRGMFAFALWDENEKKMFIARDRLGKKPVFYSYDEKYFAFASELKALLKYPGIRKDIDPQALDLYLTFQYVPAPRTIFKQVQKLMPAHYLVFKNNKLTIKRYWQLSSYSDERLSAAQYSEGIRHQLDEAVRLRLRSDVPVGAFLSGGIDSSAIVGLMAKHSNQPIKTFSVGFSERQYDELKFAKIIARQFNTEHFELIVKPDIVGILPQIVQYYGEPFADYSCIPTYYLSQFAASKVKVVLNGDGGDESFAGYDRYTACLIAQKIDKMPVFFTKLLQQTASLLPAGKDIRALSWRLKRFFDGVGYVPQERYRRWMSFFNQQEKELLLSNDLKNKIGLNNDRDWLDKYFQSRRGLDFVKSVIDVDIETYLPNALLVKMDISSMAHSLEARSPFLDHKFMEYTAGIPLDLKLQGFKRKVILKQALSGLLPKQIIQRPKAGFGIPMADWFRGELKDYMQDILLSSKAVKDGYFEQNYINSIIDEHMSKKTDNGYKLWSLLMFELWLTQFV
ncbi:MAG: asparagine synthase (glutamine-hydrolyzing) [PVC group bacterium]|nr:asparagine synthase (glutamine-hydrolyzing) [PVC group bacterium]